MDSELAAVVSFDTSGCSAEIGPPCQPPHPRLRELCGRGHRKDIGACRWGGDLRDAEFAHEEAFAFINFQEPRLLTPIRPRQDQTSMDGGEVPKAPFLKEKLLLLCLWLLREKGSLSFGAVSYTRLLMPIE